MDTISLMEGLKLLGSLVATIKGMLDSLPKNEKKVETIEVLERAENQLKIAEAQIMKGLGYEFCRNHIPPEIMLSKDDKNWECPHCGNKKNTEPPKPKFFVARQ